MLESNRKTVQYAYWYQSKCPWIIYVLVWENKAQFYSWKELVKHALEEAEMEEPDVGNSYHTSTQLPLSHCSNCQLECTKRVAALGGCSCVHATDRCCGLSGIWTSWKRVSGTTPSRWLWLPRWLKWCSLVNGFPVQEAFLKDDQYNASGEPFPGQDFTSWRVVNQWTTYFMFLFLEKWYSPQIHRIRLFPQHVTCDEGTAPALPGGWSPGLSRAYDGHVWPVSTRGFDAELRLKSDVSWQDEYIDLD